MSSSEMSPDFAMTISPTCLAVALGPGPVAVGFVMASGPPISIVSGVPAGRLVDRRGSDHVSALGLSRNLDLIAGASLMGAGLAFGVGTADLARFIGPAFAAGMNRTFLLAAAMMGVALAITLGSRGQSYERHPRCGTGVEFRHFRPGARFRGRGHLIA